MSGVIGIGMVSTSEHVADVIHMLLNAILPPESS